MRHKVGATLLTGSIILGILFYMTGNLISDEKPAVVIAAGPTWNVSQTEIILNWLVAVPIGVCFAIGIGLLVDSEKNLN